MLTEKIEATIRTLYDDVFNEGKTDLIPALISPATPGQNPLFPNGTAALDRYLHLARSVPNEVKRIAIQGDLAFVHVLYPGWLGKAHFAVDIFRFDSNGKIIEHWDVMEPVEEGTANGTPMR